MDLSKAKEIRLFNADTLEYSGSIVIENEKFWEYRDVDNDHLMETTRGLPLKGVLTSLIYFNIVYEVVDLYLN
ncbi:MAG TPA: hypothetical protein PK573_08020 [Spirochaetota bacterium]|nr:hypothetical protein [Spirochaetota bacterium]HRZ27391.1 hypothetical protein [Spirochaetota bacterium]HSA16680.1 hypothetical protein [Spirochaetota bacterium]